MYRFVIFPFREKTIFQYEQLLKKYNAEVDPNQPALVPKVTICHITILDCLDL